MPPLNPELQLRSIDVDGVERSFWIPDRRHRGEVGVIVAFHDNGETGPKLARRTGWVRRAHEAGYNVVFPDALERVWDDHGSGRRDGADDDRFFSVLVSHLRGRGEFSQAPPWVIGYGENGGAFVERLAREGVHDLAGVVLSGGTARGASRALTPAPIRPVPIRLDDPPKPGKRRPGLRTRLALKDVRGHEVVDAETVRADWAAVGASADGLAEVLGA